MLLRKRGSPAVSRACSFWPPACPPDHRWEEDRAALAEALKRNVTMAQEDEAEALADRMIRLHKRLERTNDAQLRAGEIAA